MKKISKKQIGAVGLAVLMSAQGPVMAAEVAQEETTSAAEVQTEEGDVTLLEAARNYLVLSVRERSNGNRLAESEWNLVLHDTKWFYGDRLVRSWK